MKFGGLPEIWIPYGQVEVSFEIKQENLSKIVEPETLSKISKEEVENRVDSITCDTLLILSGTRGTEELLNILLERSKEIKVLLHTKATQSLARRKSAELSIKCEPFNSERLVEVGSLEGSQAQIFEQVKENQKIAILSSVHLDPLFGLSSAASELLSASPSLKEKAFFSSFDEIPCNSSFEKSSASKYATSLLQTCPSADVIEVIESARSGLLDFYYGDPESVHAQTIDFWRKTFRTNFDGKSDRIIFGSGGWDNDRTFYDAISRSFFNIACNLVAERGQKSRICMLAECSQGLGSDAFLRYVSGRLVLPGSKLNEEVKYFDGLEALLGFYKISSELDLSLVSTLPNYFANRFDFKPVKGARQAPAAVLPQGSRAKTLVIPDASRSYFGQ
jgi:hypothetical protein